jgi:hypothetical protein
MLSTHSRRIDSNQPFGKCLSAPGSSGSNNFQNLRSLLPARTTSPTLSPNSASGETCGRFPCVGLASTREIIARRSSQ